MILRSSISTTRALCQIVGGEFIAGLNNEFDRGLNLLVTVSKVSWSMIEGTGISSHCSGGSSVPMCVGF
jgi:hypothetical protein